MELNINGHLVSSPIQLVNILLGVNQFVDPPKEGVAEGETVIGTLNDEERAVLSAAEMIADANNTLARDAGKSGERPTQELLRRLDTFRKWTDYLMQSIFWPGLKLRFGEELSKFESNGVGKVSIALRAGWQVAISKSEEALPFSLAAMFAAAMGERGMSTLQVGEGVHDCAQCDEYDGCDLPIKEPRGGSRPQPVWPDGVGDTDPHH